MGHAGYKCRRCGLTASSKCVKSRSIFTSSPTENMLSNLMGYDIESIEGREYSHVKLFFHYRPNQPQKDMLEDVLNLIRGMTDEDVKYYICGQHDWELLTPTCGLGCCKREEKGEIDGGVEVEGEGQEDRTQVAVALAEELHRVEALGDQREEATSETREALRKGDGKEARS